MTTVTGHSVAQKRNDLGISQAHLAQQLGISRNYLSQIETGKANNLSHSLYTKLLQFLNDVPVSQEPAKLDQIIARLDKIDERVNDLLELAERVLRGR